jgi:hypothetical protein
VLSRCTPAPRVVSCPHAPPDPVQLLFGPYTPPPLKKGERTHCLYRDALVVVTSWSDGRISWPAAAPRTPAAASRAS